MNTFECFNFSQTRRYFEKKSRVNLAKFGCNLPPISKYWLNINLFWIFIVNYKWFDKKLSNPDDRSFKQEVAEEIFHDRFQTTYIPFKSIQNSSLYMYRVSFRGRRGSSPPPPLEKYLPPPCKLETTILKQWESRL